jgi:hypothetical protein
VKIGITNLSILALTGSILFSSLNSTSQAANSESALIAQLHAQIKTLQSQAAYNVKFQKGTVSQVNQNTESIWAIQDSLKALKECINQNIAWLSQQRTPGQC